MQNYHRSAQALLKLLSHVLAYYLALLWESCQLYTTLFVETKSALREPKESPHQEQKYTLFDL